MFSGGLLLASASQEAGYIQGRVATDRKVFLMRRHPPQRIGGRSQHRDRCPFTPHCPSPALYCHVRGSWFFPLSPSSMAFSASGTRRFADGHTGYTELQKHTCLRPSNSGSRRHLGILPPTLWSNNTLLKWALQGHSSQVDFITASLVLQGCALQHFTVMIKTTKKAVLLLWCYILRNQELCWENRKFQPNNELEQVLKRVLLWKSLGQNYYNQILSSEYHQWIRVTRQSRNPLWCWCIKGCAPQRVICKYNSISRLFSRPVTSAVTASF